MKMYLLVRRFGYRAANVRSGKTIHMRPGTLDLADFFKLGKDQMAIVPYTDDDAVGRYHRLLAGLSTPGGTPDNHETYELSTDATGTGESSRVYFVKFSDWKMYFGGAETVSMESDWNVISVMKEVAF